MQTLIEVADETFVLPTPFPIPGFGTIYVNAMVIRAQEPILVDTGAPIFRDEYLETAFSLVDPADVKWVFLSHDDRDHSGNMMQVLDACPNARLISTFVGTGRMTEEWDIPFPRAYFLNDGESFSAGDRTLTAIRPPYFDSPSTRGLWDSSTGVFFSVDTFGALVQEACEDVSDVPADVYTEGFNWFNRANHPWHEFTDSSKIDVVIDRIRALDPRVLVTSHGPPAVNRTNQLCEMIAAISAMEPLVHPTQADLEQMLASMAPPEPPPAPPV